MDDGQTPRMMTDPYAMVGAVKDGSFTVTLGGTDEPDDTIMRGRLLPGHARADVDSRSGRRGHRDILPAGPVQRHGESPLHRYAGWGR